MSNSAYIEYKLLWTTSQLVVELDHVYIKFRHFTLDFTCS